jgi:hypothetical protein
MYAGVRYTKRIPYARDSRASVVSKEIPYAYMNSLC